MSFRLFVVPIFAAATLGAHPAGDSTAGSNDMLHLEEFVVTASPFQRNQADLAQATNVLSGAALLLRNQPTIGETLTGLPGVSSTYFGPGASRPVIRGLGGDRIRILDNGVGTIDASAISPDHAVSVEPFLIDRIEVVCSPASLLYGSSAVGGAVNLLTNRIATEQPGRAVTGVLDARVNSVANERALGGSFNLTLEAEAAGAVVLHVDGFRRETDEVKIPGYALSAHEREHALEEALEHGEEMPEFAKGKLPNSSVDTKGRAAGVSWVGTRGHVGFVFSELNSRYGVPGHAHLHHAHDDTDEDHDAHEEGEAVSIDLRQRRLDVQGELTEVFGVFSGARFKFGAANYRHRELAGDEVGTTYRNRGFDGRLEVLHTDLAGLAGTWGVQLGENNLEAVGDEAFLPPAKTRNQAVFMFEEFKLGALTPQFGARYESQRIALRDGSGAVRRDDAFGFSTGAVWNPVTGWIIGTSLTLTERAPNAQELFADGPHVGTNAYEIGDAALAREKSLGVEFNVRRRLGFVTGEVSLFLNRFRDYIYERATGEHAVRDEHGYEIHPPHYDHENNDDGHNDHTHGHGDRALPVYRYSSTDADFYGAEAEVVFHLHESALRRLDWKIGADFVRAKDGAGDPLPRIPAARYTTSLDWAAGKWSAGAAYQYTSKQTRVAAEETPSGGYGVVNAYVAWRHLVGRHVWEVFVRGSNLTNDEARSHTSFLKERVPLPGRDFTVGVRWEF